MLAASGLCAAAVEGTGSIPARQLLTGSDKRGGEISLHGATETSDEDLIGYSRTGDAGAVELLYRRHHDAAFRFATAGRATNPTPRTWPTKPSSKSWPPSAAATARTPLFRPYLFRAVRTVAADHWEQQSKEIPSEEPADTPVQDPGLEAPRPMTA